MTAINHALTGAVIGLVVGEPLIALPAAFASHYLCDALPHFGVNVPENIKLKSRAFRDYLVAEAALCFLLVVCLAVFQPQHWFLAALCAFVAASPDFASANRYFKIRGDLPWQPSFYTAFANSIQWFERPIGALVEGAWFIAALIILVPFLR